MTIIRFYPRDGEDQLNRPDGVLYEWFTRINTLKPIVPQRAGGKTTSSISGDSGETRVRGTVYEDTFVIPQIRLAELPIARDFVAAMIYGYGNPFYLDATDGFGIHRPFWGVVLENVLKPNNETCTEWSLSVPFREVKEP